MRLVVGRVSVSGLEVAICSGAKVLFGFVRIGMGELLYMMVPQGPYRRFSKSVRYRMRYSRISCTPAILLKSPDTSNVQSRRIASVNILY